MDKRITIISQTKEQSKENKEKYTYIAGKMENGSRELIKINMPIDNIDIMGTFFSILHVRITLMQHLVSETRQL